ncbi:MAG TPA: hypothetical protein VM509_00700 [Planctomycetota bacterium]|nr:hypothetical protein [Planctomycetota bacterium]
MFTLSLVACALLVAQKPAAPPKAVAQDAAPLFTRVAVIGASASAGFNLQISLADALDAQIAVAHEAPKSFAKESMFLSPEKVGTEQVTKVVALAPTLVVAADFLFWFGYGEVTAEAERLENLDAGLALLEPVKCPLIVSHFPDMTPAVGKMLMLSQLPKPETLKALDARLDAWAKKRGRVAFVAMPEMLSKLRSGEKWKLGGVAIEPATQKSRWMQPDELHPTARGLGVLARLCIDVACAPPLTAKPEEFRADLAPVLDTLHDLDASRAKTRIR